MTSARPVTQDLTPPAQATAQPTGALLERMALSAHDAMVAIGLDLSVLAWNPAAERLYGYPAAEVVGRHIDLLIPADHRGDEREIVTLMAAGARLDRYRTSRTHRDGSLINVLVTVSPLTDARGQIIGLTSISRGLSERERAESSFQAVLEAAPERVRLEDRLQHTQRLESLGQLAGGVAHDFNNLVAVILNFGAFIVEEATDRGLERIASDAQQIVRAGQRGAELTHQLLAFARREVVRPRVLDLNQVVRDVEKMLCRSIGEHIALATNLGVALPHVLADPGQLEQVLVNLAVNARDAMPGGGQLTIDTKVHHVDDQAAAARPALRPQTYVRLRVADTGSGMPGNVMEHAMEPFFTTKPSGEGTGLGLATVYGIITQAGGDLNLYSEPGLGTTISILLPATDQHLPDEAAAEHAGAEHAGATAAGDETILVVEDEDALREAVCRMLTTAGYLVLDAGDGTAALELADTYPGVIDLVLTDVVMPKMLGKELAERLTQARPGTPVMYTSGYARPVLASRGTLEDDVVLVAKPFTRMELLAAVRYCIDRTNT